MRKLSFIILSVLALTSCEKPISPETAKAFVGEYWMETSTVVIEGREEYPLKENSLWSPVSIYVENGELFVQTNWYGAPYLSDEFRENYWIIEYPERPDFMPLRKVSHEDEDGNSEGEGIENITVNNKAEVILRNCLVYVLRNGVYVKSHPNYIKSASSTIMTFEKFDPVEVVITTTDGTPLGSVKVWYEYGEMVKKGDIITWEVELKWDNGDISSAALMDGRDKIIHRNTLYKR